MKRRKTVYGHHPCATAHVGLITIATVAFIMTGCIERTTVGPDGVSRAEALGAVTALPHYQAPTGAVAPDDTQASTYQTDRRFGPEPRE